MYEKNRLGAHYATTTISFFFSTIKESRLKTQATCIYIYQTIRVFMISLKRSRHTCSVRKRLAASDAVRPMCLGSSNRTTISPRLSTASNAAAVVASWSFSTVSICRKISVEIPLTCINKIKSLKALELHDIYCLLMNRVIKRHALSFKCD